MKLAKFYRLLNTLSIDVMLGSVCGALMFAKMLQVTLLPYGIAALALSVWIIYTTDHLIDAKDVTGSASTTRHRFHQQHFKILLMMLLAAIGAVVVLLFFIRVQVLHGGLLLMGAVSLYLLLHRYLKIPKEILISMLYTCGVLLPSFMVTTLSWQALPLASIIMFMLSALANLLVFSWYDYEKDKQDGFKSMAITLGKGSTQMIVWLIGLTSIFLCWLAKDSTAALLIFAMIALQVVLISAPLFFVKQERYRLVGDAAFMLPLLYLFL
jgi:4-hydroxybenzoate polyprenyltransferase